MLVIFDEDRLILGEQVAHTTTVLVIYCQLTGEAWFGLSTTIGAARKASAGAADGLYGGYLLQPSPPNRFSREAL